MEVLDLGCIEVHCCERDVCTFMHRASFIDARQGILRRVALQRRSPMQPVWGGSR